MKLKKEVGKIINRFDFSLKLPKDVSLSGLSFEELDRYNLVSNSYGLVEKFKNNIPKGWYGFAIGMAPKSWYTAIEEVLDLLISKDPNFEIQQIKMKFGGIRFYVDSQIIEDIAQIGSMMEDVMYDERFIY